MEYSENIYTITSSKIKTLAGGLIQRTSSMLDDIASKTTLKKKMMNNRGKRSKKLKEVNPVENRNKNPKSFLKTSSFEKEVPPSHILQEHAYKPFFYRNNL